MTFAELCRRYFECSLHDVKTARKSLYNSVVIVCPYNRTLDMLYIQDARQGFHFPWIGTLMSLSVVTYVITYYLISDCYTDFVIYLYRILGFGYNDRK